MVPKPSDHGPEQLEADLIAYLIDTDKITHINTNPSPDDFGPDRRSDHLFRVLLPRTWRGLRTRQQH